MALNQTGTHVLLLRLGYWATAIADFSIAVLVLIPERMALSDIAYPMGLTSTIAFSWGILLLIADRKPVERRWVLIPTMIVVGLLSLVRIIFTLNETVEFSPAFLLLGVTLILIMAFGYHTSGKLVCKDAG